MQWEPDAILNVRGSTVGKEMQIRKERIDG